MRPDQESIDLRFDRAQRNTAIGAGVEAVAAVVAEYERLTRLHLVDAGKRRRLGLHDQVRAVIQELEPEPPVERAAASVRLHVEVVARIARGDWPVVDEDRAPSHGDPVARETDHPFDDRGAPGRRAVEGRCRENHDCAAARRKTRARPARASRDDVVGLEGGEHRFADDAVRTSGIGAKQERRSPGGDDGEREAEEIASAEAASRRSRRRARAGTGESVSPVPSDSGEQEKETYTEGERETMTERGDEAGKARPNRRNQVATSKQRCGRWSERRRDCLCDLSGCASHRRVPHGGRGLGGHFSSVH